jgi:hypothetical protein
MNKFAQFFNKIIKFILGLFQRPKRWLIYGLGSTLPSPLSPRKDEPLFPLEDKGEPIPRIRNTGGRPYTKYSDLLIFLAEGCIGNKFPVGSTFYIPRKVYVEHHITEGKPGSNPMSYYNGPIKRELHNHSFFELRGIKFEQRLVSFNENGTGYTAGEPLFEIKRIE